MAPVAISSFAATTTSMATPLASSSSVATLAEAARKYPRTTSAGSKGIPWRSSTVR